ncbi:MAG TPA: DUF177 domain-containing protein [Gemmatimonadetes bacterium]|nr:DUF177 domain-containing protein [Gemmatimonadota bacterium]
MGLGIVFSTMLKVDLGDLERQQALRVEGRIEVEDGLFAGCSFVLENPLNVVLDATWAGSGELVVRGGLKGAVLQDCRRCLGQVERLVDIDITLLFVPPDLLEEDDSETYRLEVGVREIDLGPPLCDELILAIPAFAECSVDCRGLCAGCGENLNEAECKCSPRGMDPRWDALRALENK